MHVLRPVVAAVIAWSLMAAAASAFPVSTVALDCPAPTSIQALLRAEEGVDHPLSVTYPAAIHRYAEGAAACYGDRVIRLTAFVAGPEGLGGTFAYQLEPTWMLDDTTIVSASDAMEDDRYVGPFMWVAVPPDLASRFASFEHRWIRLTGQFDHPAAGDCRITAGTPTPPEGVAGEICRTSFVVTAIDAVPRVPPTDALTLLGTGPDRAPVWLSLIALATVVASVAHLARRRS